MRARPSLRPQCGTYAGRQAHRKAAEYPCPACQAAANRYQQQRRFVKGSQRDPFRCPGCGSVFPAHVCAMAGAS